MKNIVVIDFHFWDKEFKEEHVDKIKNLIQNLDCRFTCHRQDIARILSQHIKNERIMCSEIYFDQYDFKEVCAMILFTEKHDLSKYKDYQDAKRNKIPIRIIRE